MIKLAILGAENSHAWHFSAALAPLDGESKIKDVELLGFYARPDTEDGRICRKKIAEKSSCTYFSDDYTDFLDKADAVMVTARHGDDHLRYARPYLEKGIPVWIDKPITCSPADVEELISLAAKYNSPLGGGSSLAHTEGIIKTKEYVAAHKDTIIGGHVTAPINMVNDYGNFWFYSQHLVQMMTETFGIGVRSVLAVSDGRGVSATYKYDDFEVTARFGTGYSVSVYSSDFDIIQETITLPEDLHMPELYGFIDIIKSGKSPLNMREFAAPVYIIDATIRSFEENKIVQINIPEF